MVVHDPVGDTQDAGGDPANIDVMAWRGNSQDDLENVTVRLPRSVRK